MYGHFITCKCSKGVNIAEVVCNGPHMWFNRLCLLQTTYIVYYGNKLLYLCNPLQ